MISSRPMQTKEDVIREIRAELYQRQGQGWFRVATGSMRPIIEPGENVLVKHIAAAAARKGDILLYRSGGDYVTHRLVGFLARGGEEVLLAKGDAGTVPEELAPADVCGRVVAIEKSGGRTLRLDSVRGRIVNGYLGWKHCRFHRLRAALDDCRERLRPNPAFPYLRFVYRVARLPAAAARGIFFKIFL